MSKNNPKPVNKQRPNSSRFPPLVPQTSEQSFRRSASFDNSFSNCSIDSKLDNRFKATDFDHNSNENQFISTNISSNSAKEVKTSIESKAEEYSVKQSENEVLSKTPSDLVPFLTSRTDQCSNEYQKLKKENQILKQNFLRMSKIIQKHSRLMTRKDEIILKLQENNSSNSLPNISKHQSIETKLNFPDISQCIDSKLKTNNQSLDLTKAFNTSKRLQIKSNEMSNNFQNFCESIASDFGQHLSQFNAMIEEIQIFLDNNKQSFNGENTQEFETKLQELNAEYSELKKSYEILMKQNMAFKPIIEFLFKLCNIESNEELPETETINSLQKFLTQMIENNETISCESEAMKLQLRAEEEYIFDLIENISEIELELELLGRNPETLKKVIDKFCHSFNHFNRKIAESFPYFESLNNILIQLYKNQLKWFEIFGKTTSASTPIDITGLEDSTTDEDIYCDNRPQTSYQSSNRLSVDNNCRQIEDSNESSDESYSKFNDFSDEISFDNFDIESINYILMAKQFDFNIKANLEVVKEEEEELEEESTEESDEESDDKSDEIFQEMNYKFNQKLNFSDNNTNNGSNYSEVESIVERVLTEMLDNIEKSLSFEEYSGNKISERVENRESNEQNISENNSIHVSGNQLNVLEEKQPNIDSDFVSEDNCSSPETLSTVKELSIELTNNNDSDHCVSEDNQRNRSGIFANNLDELKQQNERQESELYLAKTRIKDLENQLSIEQNIEYLSKNHNQKEQYLSDELRAWKELVVQQKAIMEKIRQELEFQQKINSEKDKTIDGLKTNSNNNILDVNETQNFSEYSVNNNNIENKNDNYVRDSDIDLNSDNEFDLNELFCQESDDNELEIISNVIPKPRNSSSNSVTSIEDIEESKVKISPKTNVKIDVWNENTSDNKNYLSDESSYSFGADKLSPISMPEELLSTNRPKVFIPYSHEDCGVRRHSCQGRVIYYGSHPRKRKLELKNVEIVFPKQLEKLNTKKVTKTQQKKL